MLRIVVTRWGQDLGTSDHPLGMVRIGSDPESDIHVDHADLSPHAIEVYLAGHRPHVRSPDRRPLRVDGHKVQGQRALEGGQTIQLGDFGFRVELVRMDANAVDEPGRCSSGRSRLEGNQLLPRPALVPDERDVLAARRVLVARGAPEKQLVHLRERGVGLAREILERHAGEEVGEIAAAIPAGAGLPPGSAPSMAAAEPRRRVALVLLLLLALGLSAALLKRIFDLSLTFTE